MPKLMIHGKQTTGSFSSADKIKYDDNQNVKEAIESIGDWVDISDQLKLASGVTCQHALYNPKTKEVEIYLTNGANALNNGTTWATISEKYRPSKTLYSWSLSSGRWTSAVTTNTVMTLFSATVYTDGAIRGYYAVSTNLYNGQFHMHYAIL